MKLELKHLASYLPYDLKGINHLKDISTLGIKDEVFTYTNFYENKRIKEKFTYLSIDSFLKEKYKPILFQLSSLTKDEMKNITKSDFNRYSEDYLDTILNTMKREINSKKLPYYLMEKLFERKFDVFGLIELGLAEPVTEDFNPYK